MAMGDKDATTDADLTLGFNAASLPTSASVLALVRHLARIEAERDYNAFLKSIENDYSGSSQKGPHT